MNTQNIHELLERMSRERLEEPYPCDQIAPSRYDPVAYGQGQTARIQQETDCPYRPGTWEYRSWSAGWCVENYRLGG